jgi:CspA family cold shock protein
MWNVERGFGFIQDDAGGPDIFLHITALQDAGISPDSLKRGDRFAYEISNTRDGKDESQQCSESVKLGRARAQGEEMRSG